jgi:hypothetical protein
MREKKGKLPSRRWSMTNGAPATVTLQVDALRRMLITTMWLDVVVAAGWWRHSATVAARSSREKIDDAPQSAPTTTGVTLTRAAYTRWTCGGE